MSEFEIVGKVSDFEEGQGRAVPVDGRMVAVFRTGDEWYAIDDLCPHMGASLAEGYVEDHTVTCPWHAWQFDVCTGTAIFDPQFQLETFAVHLEGDELLVEV